MNTESKGRAWYDKIYRKLETILVEVDNLASQGKVSSKSSDPPELESVRDEPEKLADEHSSKEKLEEHIDCNQKATNSLSHKDSISSLDKDRACAQESQSTHPTPENFRTARTCIDDTFVISTGNHDEFFIEDFDVALLDTIDLYDMTFREDHSDFDDDNLLYAARDRTKQLRSFKRKVMDALTSKRRREKEYEQLAIWFGDADMGSDLMKTKEHAKTSLDSKSSQSNVPFASEDSEWELL